MYTMLIKVLVKGIYPLISWEFRILESQIKFWECGLTFFFIFKRKREFTF
jgi:hypothetical protein